MATETLQVVLSANAAAFTRGMDAASKSVEQAGRKMSELGGKLAGVGTALTAFGGLMANEAAKYDGTVNKAVKELKGAYSALAVEIGRALVPAIQSLALFVSELVHAWRAMNPEVREAIVHYGGLAAGIAGVVGVGMKLGGLGLQFAALAIQMAPVLLAVVTLGIAIAVAYKIWKQNIGGMRDSAKGLFTAIRGWAGQIPGWFDKAFQLAKVPLLALGRALQFSLGALFGKAPGSLADTLREAMDAFEGASLGDMFEGALDALVESGRWVGDAIEDGVADAAALFKKEFGGARGLVSAGLTLDEKAKAAIPGREGKLTDEDWLEGEKAHAKWLEGLFKSSEDAWGAVDAKERDMRDAMSSTLTDVSATVDSFRDRFKTLAGGIGQSATSKLGPNASGVMQGAQQGSAAGPWGALIGAVAALLMQTQGFSKLVQQIEAGLGFFASALEPLLEPMVVIGQLANDLLGAFGPLVDAFKLIGTAALFMTKGILNVNELILTGMRDIANALGLTGVAEYINVALLTPVSKAAMSAQTALDRLANSSSKSATTQEKAATATAKAMQSWAESITNSPTGYRVASARYGAADIGGTSGGMLPGSGGGPVIEVTINGDMAAVVSSVEVKQKKKSYNRTGSNYANTGKPVRGGDEP